MLLILKRLISIHALVKRATKPSDKRRPLQRYFNPRPREEGDAVKLLFSPRFAISIHALVKRATFSDGYDLDNEVFQSTPS